MAQRPNTMQAALARTQRGLHVAALPGCIAVCVMRNPHHLFTPATPSSSVPGGLQKAVKTCTWCACSGCMQSNAHTRSDKATTPTSCWRGGRRLGLKGAGYTSLQLACCCILSHHSVLVLALGTPSQTDGMLAAPITRGRQQLPRHMPLPFPKSARHGA